MTQLQQKLTLPAAMAEKLDVVRRRTFRVRIGTAIVAAVAVLLAAMAMAMLIDWLTTLYDFRWRALLTYSAWSAAAATLVVWAVTVWRHTRRADGMASTVDREMPELEERWSTVTEVTANGQSSSVHPAMFQQVSAEAQSWTPRVEPDRVVPLDGLVRALLFLTAITAILGLAVLFASHRTTVLLKRFWQPYTAISATEITDLSGDMVVGRGESLEIAASLVGAPVEQASLMLEPEAGEQTTITLIPRGDDHDQLNHRLRSVKQPMRYRLRAGDGQSPWFDVVVADRPKLGQVRLTLTPPAYTRKEPEVINKLPRRITVLEGSHVEVAMKPKQDLRSLRLKFGPELVEQLSVDEQGWYRWETTLTKNVSFQPLLTEEHGLDNLRPPTCELRVRPDRPPVVKIITPNSEMAVRPDDTVPVTFVASDDVGIHQAELVVYDESQTVDGKPTVLDRIPVPLGDQQGAVQVKATVKLDLSQYETADGSELSFSIRVREDRGQQQMANSGSSQTSPATQQGASPTQQAGVDSTAAPTEATTDGGAPATNEPTSDAANQLAGVTADDTEPTESGTADGASMTAAAAESGDLSDSAQVATDQNASLATSENTGEAGADTSDSGATAAKGQVSNTNPSGGQQQANAGASRPNENDPSSEDGSMGEVAQSTGPQTPAENNSDPAAGDLASSEEDAMADNTGRTTSSNRQALNTGDSPPPAGPSQQMATPDEPRAGEASPRDQSTDDSATADSTPSESQSGATEPSGSNDQSNNASSPSASPAEMQNGSEAQTSPSQSSSGSSASQPSQPQDSSPSPGNPMTKRQLDVERKAQSSNSQRMRIKIDQWAGSYDGQQRIKLEISIGPRLEELDRALEKAQLLSRAALDDADQGKPWESKQSRDIQRADEHIDAAIKVVEDLENETYGTPYAFVGLQLVDIKQAHISLARRDFWKSLQTADEARVGHVRDGWQHTTRARELLVLLTERFERTKLEYKMADSVANIKKMYQVFVEDSMALLRPEENEGGRYARKVAEFDLDEEYLKRLEEVLKMREEMRAELARILADDPRLLRRFLDAQKNRSVVLRNDLDRLIERQSELNRETRAWGAAEPTDRPALAKILMGRHIESAQDISIAAADLYDRFETWSPLGKESEDADFQATSRVLSEIATATRELSADGLKYVAEANRSKKVEAEAEEGAAPPNSDEVVEVSFEDDEALEEISVAAQQLYEQFTQLEVLLRRIGGKPDRVDIAYFATNRLIETRRLIEQTSAWVRQLKQQQEGNYHRSAEVAQYRLAMETDTLAGKLATLEQTMAGLLQNEDNMLPQAIAEKARGLLAALDEQAAPNQLAATYALRRNQMSRATAREESALAGLELAGKLYDEMIEAAIKELDKLPVQDPVASLLDDPTLDELLRELEQELPINEALGIPQRPSNLQIMSDWLRPGGDNATMTGGGGRQMIVEQMQRQEQMRQRRLDRAYRRAVARALKETEAEDLVKDVPKLAQETNDWNKLASQLEDDLRQGRDKAPPERYRRAIEQYFRQVSGADQAEE